MIPERVRTIETGKVSNGVSRYPPSRRCDGSEAGQGAGAGQLGKAAEEVGLTLALEQHCHADIVAALLTLLRVIHGSVTARSEDAAEGGHLVHLLAEFADETLVRVDEPVTLNVPVLLGEVHAEGDIQIVVVVVGKELPIVREDVVQFDATDGDGADRLRPQPLAVGRADDGGLERERDTSSSVGHVTDDPCVECARERNERSERRLGAINRGGRRSRSGFRFHDLGPRGVERFLRGLIEAGE